MKALKTHALGSRIVAPPILNMSPRRFTAYKVYLATQERAGFVHNLTLEEVSDEKRFPYGPQHDAIGKFIWTYGINNGCLI